MLEPEWQPWGPDSPGYPKCPVAPGTDCEVRFEDGETSRDTTPQMWTWHHIGYGDHDIIAYRVWPTKDDARALLVDARGVIESLRPKTGPSGIRGIDEISAAFTVIEPPPILARIDAYLERNP